MNTNEVTKLFYHEKEGCQANALHFVELDITNF
jgi:hypothetical protein